MLAAAGIVEMISGPRRTPVRQNPYEPPFFNAPLHLIFRQIGKAEPVERGLAHHADGIECRTPLNADFQLAPSFLKIPYIEAAMGRQPQSDAVVLGQVLRNVGPLPPLK